MTLRCLPRVQADQCHPKEARNSHLELMANNTLGEQNNSIHKRHADPFSTSSQHHQQMFEVKQQKPSQAPVPQIFCLYHLTEPFYHISQPCLLSITKDDWQNPENDIDKQGGRVTAASGGIKSAPCRSWCPLHSQD